MTSWSKGKGRPSLPVGWGTRTAATLCANCRYCPFSRRNRRIVETFQIDLDIRRVAPSMAARDNATATVRSEAIFGLVMARKDSAMRCTSADFLRDGKRNLDGLHALRH